MTHRLLLGCIADDFTGGSDAASFLKKGGLRTILINGNAYERYQPSNEDEAIVIALKIRSIEPEAAAAEASAAAKWLLEQGAEHLYFKYCSTFDSTDRGNIGPVTDSLMELMNCPFTILCPALPVNKRTVTNGILYVDGVPLGESHMRYHPLNPMLHSKVEELMARQSKYPCVTLNHRTLQNGREALDAHIRNLLQTAKRLTGVVDYDITDQGDFLAALFGKLPLLTGGSGLLEFLARRYKPGGERQEEVFPKPCPCGPRLLLAGSCSRMTQKQIRRYMDQGKAAIRIDPKKLISGEQRVEELKKAIRFADRDLLLYSTVPPEDLTTGSNGEDVSGLLESVMGELALCGRDFGYKKIVVAGGETSGAVVQRLNYAIFKIGRDAAPGVPEMMPLEGPELRLVLKSGNFGDEAFFLNALTEV